MDNNNQGRGGDLVLAPGEYAFVLDTTKGNVNTITGPNKVSMSNTDQPVIWDAKQKKFVQVTGEQAKRTNPVAPEGYYIALYNPVRSTTAKGDDKAESIVNVPPRDGSNTVSATPLSVGHRVNIPGPATFALWPGQFSQVIQGHHLRSNQYLLVQIYNDKEATENWKRAVVKPAASTDGAVATTPPPAALETLAPGKLLVIKGTDVSFFIPPTGMKVVPETPHGSDFIREAVTLERLEYCILLDENGNKRVVLGPAVVFPEPTETFVEHDGERKVRAIELNETSGLYIKVIAPYKEDDGTERKIGDELFITGKDHPIYFQREEHSVIRYGNQTKHYAVAIPPGEGRYVLNRQTSEVRTAKGPEMLLCDPRKEVIIRRVLSQKEVSLWYPGNARALQVNRELEMLNSAEDVGAASMTMTASAAAYEAGRPVSANLRASNYLEAEDRVRTSRQIAGDKFERGTKFTPPRTLTLDTKYEGAVAVSPWSGYAVMVVDKTGKRKVVEGPTTILLEYDESLAMLELSTGTPKVDTNLLQTVYLRTTNNKVSDQFVVETKDLVKVTIRISYRLNFEGVDDKQKEAWFSVENYIRLLCDHMRSLVRNKAKRTGIADFYGNTIDLVRDATLGEVPANGGHRPGKFFNENNMKVYDVEVLDVAIQDPVVAQLLGAEQKESLTSALEISRAERKLESTKTLEGFKRETLTEVRQTEAASKEAEDARIKEKLELELARIVAESSAEQKKHDHKLAIQSTLDTLNTAEIARNNAQTEAQAAAKERLVTIEAKRLEAETKEIIARAKEMNPALAAALTTFADQALMEKAVTALGPLSAMSGISAADVLARLFKGSPFEGALNMLGTRTRLPELTSPES